MEVIVFSPSRCSLYTICVVELLMRNNIRVNKIFVRKLFNIKRFLSEFERDGSRLLKKIWRKLVLKKNAYKSVDYETIISFMQQQNIDLKTVDDFNDKYGIQIVYCNTLNDQSVEDELKKVANKVIVFTGGGLIRENILVNAGAGILNCHMGILPMYRGMDVVEWPILEQKFNQIGITVHLMDKGVDTGAILKLLKIKVDANESIKQIRDRFEPIMCRFLVETCVEYLHGIATPTSQNTRDGKQYFIMHPRLLEAAKLNLLNFR